MNRLAGKVLGDFFKTGAGMISSAAEKGSLGYLQNAVNAAANAVDTPGVMGNIAQFASGMDPAAVAKLVGSAAPVAATAAVGGLVGALNQPPSRQMYAQSQYQLPMRSMGTHVAYANQQYIPGVSALTNAQAGEAVLEQQKFQHQLQLIQAREMASQGSGSLYGGSYLSGGGSDLQGYMAAAQQAINSPAPRYG
jgi:hypothetical protein